LNTEELKDLFCDLTGRQFDPDPFFKYLDILLKWNAKVNLVGTNDPKRIIEELIVDSLAPLPYLGSVRSLLDFGSGAGLPGIPLKLARPDLKVTLSEANAKKVSFLKEARRQLGIFDIIICEGRLEDAENTKQDVIVSRGTISITEIINRMKGLLAPSGSIILFKGSMNNSEIRQAENMKDYTTQVISYGRPHRNVERRLVIMKSR